MGKDIETKCLICGKTITKSVRGPVAKTCSQKCRKALSRKIVTGLTDNTIISKPVTPITYEILGNDTMTIRDTQLFPERLGKRYLISCPNCQAKLSMPGNLGQSISCRKCGQYWVNTATLALAVCKMSKAGEHPVVNFLMINKYLPLEIHSHHGYMAVITELQALQDDQSSLCIV